MHFERNNKEYKRYLQGLRPFRNTLPSSIKKILNKKGFAYSEIIGRWKFLVGDKISKLAFPKGIRANSDNKNGILILGIKRGNEVDVEYSKKEIIDKINSYFGYKLINQVKLEAFGNVATIKKKNYKNTKNNLKNNLEKKINSIKNESIKKAFINLINEIKS